MTNHSTLRALIAEDEPLLAEALAIELRLAWPELELLPAVGDGLSALRVALEQQPELLFFDIRMPGMGGLEAAARLTDEWPGAAQGGRPFPLLVFVTAYDQYAVQAFEAQAMDYLLKPVQTERLRATVARLQRLLAERARSAELPDQSQRDLTAVPDAGLERTLDQLRALLKPPSDAARQSPLKVIQASTGNTIHVVPLDEVLYFEAADKYVRVLTAAREYLIRTPLRELLPQLDPQQFWQIHRGTVVRAQSMDALTRDEAGKLFLQLRGRPERLPVSRLYAYQFKAM